MKSTTLLEALKTDPRLVSARAAGANWQIDDRTLPTFELRQLVVTTLLKAGRPFTAADLGLALDFLRVGALRTVEGGAR